MTFPRTWYSRDVVLHERDILLKRITLSNVSSLSSRLSQRPVSLSLFYPSFTSPFFLFSQFSASIAKRWGIFWVDNSPGACWEHVAVLLLPLFGGCKQKPAGRAAKAWRACPRAPCHLARTRQRRRVAEAVLSIKFNFMTASLSYSSNGRFFFFYKKFSIQVQSFLNFCSSPRNACIEKR